MCKLNLVRLSLVSLLSLVCTLSCGPDSSFAPTTVPESEIPSASTADIKKADDIKETDTPADSKLPVEEPGTMSNSKTSQSPAQPSQLVDLSPSDLRAPIQPILPAPPLPSVPPVTKPLPITPPNPPQITPPKCESSIPIVAANQSAALKWSGDGPFTYAIERSTQTGELGTIVALDNDLVRYLAPTRIAKSEDVSIAAINAVGEKASCLVRLKADGALGVADDGRTPGLVGTVFQVPLAERNSSARIKSAWFAGTPLSTIVMPRIDVPNTPYEQGFPGYPNLTSWFAIRFRAQIQIPESGYYGFQTQSDDGSLLYIDGRTVVRNDTVHAITTVTNDQVYLEAGLHDIQLDYFQGPPIYIAMSLLWRKPADNHYTIIPASQLSRPKI